VRFCALRPYESGLIKSNPKRIISEKTNWRCFNELKRELRARRGRLPMQRQERRREGLGGRTHVFLAATVARVGLDPAKGIQWVTDPKVKPMELFADIPLRPSACCARS
jgi:hypothetical protein